jgi:hypothetical protein
MGGAAGHMQHLYDNRDFTVREIKKILKNAAEGRLQSTIEKFDGLNLVFTWDDSTSQLKTARSLGDIKGGGLNQAAFAAKFAGRGHLKDAFCEAFQALDRFVSTLGKDQKASIFGDRGNRWYSVEVLHSSSANVIAYGHKAIVFHSWPIMELSTAGNIQAADDVSGFEILAPRTMKLISGWKFYGPQHVKLGRIADKSALTNAVARIDAAVESAGLNDCSTLHQCLSKQLRLDVSRLGFKKEIADMIVDRAMEAQDAPTLNDIKKMINKSQYEDVAAFIRASPGLLRSYIEPFELAINDFAIELLRGVRSNLVIDHTGELDRIRSATASAMVSIESLGDPSAKNFLEFQRKKLGSVDNIASTAEGIMFSHKGRTYKFTGSFASVNKILGFFRYGNKSQKAA